MEFKKAETLRLKKKTTYTIQGALIKRRKSRLQETEEQKEDSRQT